MTKLAVVAYPTLEEADREWIESVRARHDPQAPLIRAHFTLAFPAELAARALVAHVSTAIATVHGPIAFLVDLARAVRDAFGNGSHVFLVPGEGGGEIVALHDRLYEGVLRPHLREDIAFIPHITVGWCRAFEACERLAAELNRRPCVVRGTVRDVEVVEVGAGGLRSVAAFTLGAGEHSPA